MAVHSEALIGRLLSFLFDIRHDAISPFRLRFCHAMSAACCLCAFILMFAAMPDDFRRYAAAATVCLS